MKRLLFSALVAGLTLAMVAGPVPVATAGQSVEIRLKDGSKWRGEVDDMVDVTYLQQRIEVKLSGRIVKAADLYVVIEGNIAGQVRQKTIFRDDIVKMRSASSDPGESVRRPKRDMDRRESRKKDAPPDGKKLGVFVLPLEGSVGGPFRHEEIVKIGKKADEYGPGQIIVLLINTDGGSSLESQYIAEEIFKLRERHRVVAWIQKAISAGCQTAMCCQEIYFMTEGSAGAITTWNPGSGQSIKGEELEAAIDHLVDIAERSGYSEHIARAMKTNKSMCSYDKDPETGEVTFYDDLSGEFVLSDDDSNLSFTSSNALHCGFSKGTADTEQELAKLLDLPQWYEVSDYGRQLAKKWQATVERASEEIPRLQAQLGYVSTSGDAIERTGAIIKIYKELLRWHDRCPNIAKQMLQPPEYYERQITELRKQLADMRRR